MIKNIEINESLHLDVTERRYWLYVQTYYMTNEKIAKLW
jgi:hypothetical protein